MLRLLWNLTKAKINQRKHGVTFQEAASVFADPLASTIDDPQHSQVDDERYITIGRSTRSRTLVVVHTDQHETIRIISARLATRKERMQYEEGHH